MPVLALASWPRRRFLVAVSVGALVVFVIALTTVMIDNPVFGRATPTTAWAWPALIVTGMLTGLLAATYVRVPGGPAPDAAPRRGGYAATVLTWFAVGCPVCNKLVVAALGMTGSLNYFEPLQPTLQFVAVLVLGWALSVRLRGERACPVPAGT